MTITGDPVKTVEIASERFDFNDTEKGSVLNHLIAGGDLSAYGLANAITRASQQVECYDRATDLERNGGQVIELAPSEWRAFNKDAA